jgi:RNA polymerase sigma-70 factor (ECF subfamily)
VDRQRLERDVRLLCERGEHNAAAALALRGYGPELFGFLVAIHRDEDEAGDSFSELSEILWRKLPGFAWQSTFRTWAYAVARNVLRTRRRGAARHARRAGRAGDSVLEGVVQQVRTETVTYLRTEKRTKLQALRDGLPEEDQMLLVLRVDRGLEWLDLVGVFAQTHGTSALDAADLTREAARLRKRFQLVKERLRELAKRQNLVD